MRLSVPDFKDNIFKIVSKKLKVSFKQKFFFFLHLMTYVVFYGLYQMQKFLHPPTAALYMFDCMVFFFKTPSGQMLCFFYGFPKPTTHHSIRWHCWFCVGIKTPGNDLRCLPVMMQKQQNVQRASIAQIPDSVTGVSEVVFSPQVRYTK